ncbi:NADPH:quinone reductase [Arthrobacter sp. H14-L1]|uniref:NADPH:quinone reductase n=1 Tax=Arthrobacter sp. H14-L1 TaxID=2996697 RepID=UPI002271D43A|nr:NADPH:quinone reductase [Arthrobacter sp. H14-L1]MCY0904551.1 NADPH:quinone reductase [Arthrobacter sp. H14-L1]
MPEPLLPPSLETQSLGTQSLMTAAYVRRRGAAASIEVGRLPRPSPAANEVLVAVESVALNPVDTLVRSGRYRTNLPLPFVVGRDLVGTVVRSGTAVQGFSTGGRVWCNSLGHDGRQGSFAEFAVVPADRLYRLPDGVDPETAIAVAHPTATAYLAWFVHGGLRPGQTVFVGGGAGNVGLAAVTTAALAGARVVASCRPEDFARCRRAGADAVIDYRDPALADHLTDRAPEGVDIFWDTSGHTDFAAAAGATVPGARVLITAAPGAATSGTAAATTNVPLAQLYTRDISVLGFVISRASVADLAGAAGLINRMLVRNQLHARITERLPLEQTASAHEHMEAGTVTGRILLHP